MLTLETLPHQIQAGDVDTVVVAFPDLYGRPVGKRVTGAYFLDHVQHHGIEVCDYLLASDIDMTPLPGFEFAGWDTGYGDLHAVVDPQTVRPLPWLPGSVLVLCDLLTMEGQPVEVSPRRILRRQIERAAGLGLEIRCATELEFYLFRDSFEEAAAKHWHGLVPHAGTVEDYQLLQTSADEYVIGRVRRQMLEAGIPVEFSKGEAGAGQHEINVTYGGALEVADRHLVFKNGVKEIAAGLGRAASFMAKWSMDSAGSSCHIHASLWDGTSGQALMAPAQGDAGGSALSAVGRQFLAGQLHAASQLAWCFAPDGQLLPALCPRLVGTDRGGVGRGQPHLRIPDGGKWCRSPGGEPHARRRREPLPGPGRHHCRRAVGDRARAHPRAGLHR